MIPLKIMKLSQTTHFFASYYFHLSHLEFSTIAAFHLSNFQSLNLATRAFKRVFDANSRFDPSLLKYFCNL